MAAVLVLNLNGKEVEVDPRNLEIYAPEVIRELKRTLPIEIHKAVKSGKMALAVWMEKILVEVETRLL